jgi:hypothetical protein
VTAPSSIDPARFLHDQLASASPDLLRSVADRLQWENALAEAKRRAQEALAAEVPAAGRAA